MSKLIHVKPSLYAMYFYDLKEIALKYGYNLILHGSLNRDLDLVAVPWQKETGIIIDMINEFCGFLGGSLMLMGNGKQYSILPQGRKAYVINMNRSYDKDGNDKQYYLDISVTPSPNEILNSII